MYSAPQAEEGNKFRYVSFCGHVTEGEIAIILCNTFWQYCSSAGGRAGPRKENKEIRENSSFTNDSVFRCLIHLIYFLPVLCAKASAAVQSYSHMDTGTKTSEAIKHEYR